MDDVVAWTIDDDVIHDVVACTIHDDVIHDDVACTMHDDVALEGVYIFFKFNYIIYLII